MKDCNPVSLPLAVNHGLRIYKDRDVPVNQKGYIPFARGHGNKQAWLHQPLRRSTQFYHES